MQVACPPPFLCDGLVEGDGWRKSLHGMGDLSRVFCARVLGRLFQIFRALGDVPGPEPGEVISCSSITQHGAGVF